ncbi:MAG: DNA repair protein [Flavobacteriales bacterium]|jgi:DNA repair protein RadC|nr:DNA repair protein [Flavobacteriales bacterium]
MKKNTHLPRRIHLRFEPPEEETQAPILNQADSCFEYLKMIWDVDTLYLQEAFYIVFLKSNLQVIGYHQLCIGGLDYCNPDMRIAFGMALKTGATAMLLAHNHPSGIQKVSKEDKKLTQKFLYIGSLLGIRIIDHIILCSEQQYVSFEDLGYMHQDSCITQ